MAAQGTHLLLVSRQDVYKRQAYNGVPSDASIIDNIGSLTGSWKALIIYDPNTKFDAGAMEFLNVSLAGAAESLSLTLDWYQIFWANEGESFDEKMCIRDRRPIVRDRIRALT